MSDLLAKWLDSLPAFLDGLLVSIGLTIVVIVVGYPCGLMLALLESARLLPARIAGRVVIEIGRGVPALVTLYVAYFGLPQAGLHFSSFAAATIALAFTTAGYTSAIFRAGLGSIDHGQSEAAASLALGPVRTMVSVVLPQALRNTAIALTGWTILVFQATSLAFTVAVPELMSHAYSVGSSTYDYTAPLTLAGALYAAVGILVLALIAMCRRYRNSIAPTATS